MTFNASESRFPLVDTYNYYGLALIVISGVSEVSVSLALTTSDSTLSADTTMTASQSSFQNLWNQIAP